MSADDVELFERWRTGDTRAGSVLVRRHFAALHRFLCSKARGGVDDLVQQTFLACAEAHGAYRGGASFRTYLFGIARLQLYRYYRATRGERELDFTTTSVFDGEKSPSDLLLQREDVQLLRLALQNVPIEHQIALELSFWDGLSAPEIAHALGIPENTVYSRLHRAKQHLRQAYERLSASREHRTRAMAVLGETRD